MAVFTFGACSERRRPKVSDVLFILLEINCFLLLFDSCVYDLYQIDQSLEFFNPKALRLVLESSGGKG